MSRLIKKRRIKGRLLILKKNLLAVSNNVDFVATTIDCWTARRKFYIGLTAHWINAEYRHQSAALACRRLKWSHIFDVLAAAIDDIHAKYKIRDKVIKTNADNGTNFVKAFAIFADNASFEESLPQPGCSLSEKSDQIDNNDSGFEFVGNQTTSDIQYTNIGDILSCSSSLQYK